MSLACAGSRFNLSTKKSPAAAVPDGVMPVEVDKHRLCPTAPTLQTHF
jgi:hypothetical protein